MKKIFLLFFLCSLSTLSFSNSSDYQTWGNLSDGGVKSIVNNPSGFYGISKVEKIDTNSQGGYPVHFSISIKATNVVSGGKLWIRLDDKNGKQLKLKHGKLIKGTHNWVVYSLTIPFVPYNAKKLLYGVWLSGKGKIEMANYRRN